MRIEKLICNTSAAAQFDEARAAPPRLSRNRIKRAMLSIAICSIAGSYALAEPATLAVSDAWSPPADKNSNLPVYMTVTNPGEADDILRSRCADIAHFTEKRTTDYGEGAPSAREVKSIPIKERDTTTLKPGGSYVTLLKIINPVKAGDAFDCQIAFRRAGSVNVRVTVKSAP